MYKHALKDRKAYRQTESDRQTDEDGKILFVNYCAQYADVFNKPRKPGA